VTRHYAPTIATSTAQKTTGPDIESNHLIASLFPENRAMNVEDLVGIRVWMKRDQFRSVSGVISSVPNAVNRDDLQSSIMESTFRIDMPSGDTIQVSGSHISKFDHESSVCKKAPALCDDTTAVETSSPDKLLKVA
jgi:hypothetical protein